MYITFQQSHTSILSRQARIYVGLDYLKIRSLLTFVRNKIQPQSKETNKLL